MNATPAKDTMTTATAVPTVAPARKRRLGLMVSVPALIVLGAGGYWLTGGRYETTENANLKQAHISVASDTSGRVVSVNVVDNQAVKAGEILFKVDDEPYRLALAQSEAALGLARLNVQQLKVAYGQAEAQAQLAAEDLAYQTSELERQRALSAKGVATATSLDDAEHQARRAVEENVVVQQSVANALAALGGDATADVDAHPSVRSALVARDEARYKLALTTVQAPADGIIYQAASFKPGQFVSVGQQLFALVESNDTWVDANFKETQLTNIRVGQDAEVTFDLLPGQPVKARVEAIGAGTGSEFSLLPAQNATGNWVKVTQRVPVRLSLIDMPHIPALASGISAEVSVDTGHGRSMRDLFPAFAAKN